MNNLNELQSGYLDIYESIPLESELKETLERVKDAGRRGYFLPSEDEEVLDVYVKYLRSRQHLHEILTDCKKVINTKDENLSWSLKLGYFTIGFAVALILRRVGQFIVSLSDVSCLVSVKLDDSEVRYGLERKSFTELYKSLTDPHNAIAFYEAVRYYEVHRSDVEKVSSELGLERIVEILLGELKFLDFRKRDALVDRLKYRWHSITRRSSSSYTKVMFHLFRFTGSRIAELKQPHRAKEGKNVNFKIIREVLEKLRPGDILVTRHEDAMSNLFLPGYWPHAAFFIGTQKQREEAGVSTENVKSCFVPGDFEVMEAKKDGVKLRNLEETLYVDEFIVIRPKLSQGKLVETIMRALSHVGKRYDFLFNFNSANRLACTEVIYRAFEGVDGVGFDLVEQAGRVCLPAEELIDQCLNGNKFELLGLYLKGQNSLLWGETVQEKFNDHRENLRSLGKIK